MSDQESPPAPSAHPGCGRDMKREDWQDAAWLDEPSNDAELIEQLEHFRFRLTFQTFRHHGCGGGEDGATGAMKTDFSNDIIFQLQEDIDPVSTERIVSLGSIAGVRELSEVARLFAVIEDDFLIELAEVVHQRKTSITL